MKELIQKLKETQNLSKKEWISLIENRSVELSDYLFAQARRGSTSILWKRDLCTRID